MVVSPPVLPLSPLAPSAPVVPVEPVAPVAPVSPFAAGAPVAPCGPAGPGTGTATTAGEAGGGTTVARSQALSASADSAAAIAVEYLMMILSLCQARIEHQMVRNHPSASIF